MSPVDPTKAEHARPLRRGAPLLPVEAVSVSYAHGLPDYNAAAIIHNARKTTAVRVS